MPDIEEIDNKLERKIDALTDTLNEVNLRVERLTGKWENDSENLRAYRATQERRVDRLDTLIFGNGEPGLRSDVADLKRSKVAIARMLWLVGGTVATLFVQRLWEIVTAHKP